MGAESSKPAAKAQPLPKYTREEVAKHNTKKDMWIIIAGKVCNVTEFIHEHPGGAKILMNVAGQDATRQFKDTGHSSTAERQIRKLVIGEVIN